jgi:6-phosphofructokinase 1
MEKYSITGMIVIGGNGSFEGAHVLAMECSVPIIGIPASIDNDIGLSRESLGVDTALNTIIEACDRITDTARSHHRRRRSSSRASAEPRGDPDGCHEMHRRRIQPHP